MPFPQTTETKLETLAWPQWPAEAKLVAQRILEQPHTQRQYYAQPRDARHAWLAERVTVKLLCPVDSEWVLL